MRLVRRTLLAWLVVALLVLAASETASVLDYQSELAVKTDFEATVWQPARNVLDGISPYPETDRRGFEALAVYPPSAFLPALPLAALPVDVAAAIFRIALAVAAFLVLWVLGVRDWRCYGLWLLSPLVVIPVLIGNATILVILCAALLWRYRNTAWAAATALSVAVAIKLFLAPLWLWLIFTRRHRAALYAAVIAPLVLLVSWALIQFDGLMRYPDLMRVMADQWGGDGALLYALGRQLGLGDGAAILSVAAGLALLATAWSVREREVASFTLVSAAALAFSPIGWTFYVGVFVVPLAVRHPRHSPVWLILPLFWTVTWWHTPLDYKSVELSVVTIVLAALFVLALCRPQAPSLRAYRSLVRA